MYVALQLEGLHFSVDFSTGWRRSVASLVVVVTARHGEKCRESSASQSNLLVFMIVLYEWFRKKTFRFHTGQGVLRMGKLVPAVLRRDADDFLRRVLLLFFQLQM